MLSATSSANLRTSPIGARSVAVEFLDAAREPDRKKWLDLWTAWPRRDIMAHPEYVRLFARPEDRAIAAAARTAEGGILYPLIVRPLALEPWAAGEKGCDLTTPYGYGGPFGWGVSEDEAASFWKAVDAWAAAQGAVTSFSRLSLFSENLIPFHGETVSGGPNIVVRVDVPDDALWSEYRSEARRSIGLAQERNVTVEFDPSGARLDEFLKIYTATMDRRGASRGYYFSREFFESFIRNLAGHFTIVHALAGRRAISSEILLLSADNAYSWLGGTLSEGFALGPNYLLKHESFLWCRARGRKTVVLGGGYQPNDGILRYKQRFTRSAGVPFLLGRKTFDAAAAGRLAERRRQWERAQGRDWSPAPEFFPEYRA